MNTVGLRWTIVAGGLLYAAACALASTVTAFWVLYPVYGVMLGTGCALSHTAAIVAVQHYFSTKRGTATGLAVAGSGMGALLLSPLYDAIIARSGWRAALRSVGVVCGLLLVVAAAAFRPLELIEDDSDSAPIADGPQDHNVVDRVVHVKGDSIDTAAAGVGNAVRSTHVEDASESTAGGAHATDGDHVVPATSGSGVPGGDPSAAAVPAESPPHGHGTTTPAHLKRVPTGLHHLPRASAWQLMHIRPFAVYCGFVVLYAFSWFAVLTHFVTFATEAGSSSADAALLVSWQGAANTAGRIGLGIVSDLLASRKVQLLQGTVGTVALATALLVPLGRFAWFRVVYMLLSGSMGGSIVSLQPQITAELVGMHNLPIAQGLFNALQSPLTLASPPFAGWLRQATGNYVGVWAVVACFTIASWLVALGLPNGLLSLKVVDRCRRRLHAGSVAGAKADKGDNIRVEWSGRRDGNRGDEDSEGGRSRLGGVHMGEVDLTPLGGR